MNYELTKFASEIVLLENNKNGNKYDLDSLRSLRRQNLNTEVGDSSAVFRVDGFSPADDSIIIISNNRFPNFVSEAVGRTVLVAKKLESQLSERVLSPSVAGTHGLQSYAFWPRHMAIADNRVLKRIQILSVYKGVFQWLGDMAQTTRLPVSLGEDLKRQYTDPLTYLINQDFISAAIKGIATQVLSAMQDNTFRPVSVVQHGDFWYGNILLEKSWPLPLHTPKPFFIIDWAGANVHGYPYVDPLRFLMSIGKRDNEILHFLDLYGTKCGLPINDVLSYVCAYIGHLGMNRNEFPLDRYLKLIDTLIGKASYVSKSFSLKTTF